METATVFLAKTINIYQKIFNYFPITNKEHSY